MMKITSFNPLVLSKDAKSIVELMEKLRFETRYNKTSEDFSYTA